MRQNLVLSYFHLKYPQWRRTAQPHEKKTLNKLRLYILVLNSDADLRCSLAFSCLSISHSVGVFVDVNLGSLMSQPGYT